MTGPRPRTSRRYGWRPGLPDIRDMKYGAVRRVDVAALPPCVDLRPGCGPVVDQLDTSSCTANALVAAVTFLDLKEGITPADPLSRLMLYYDERVIEDTVAQDNGAQIRDGIKILAAHGVCSEDSWPFDPAALFNQPPPNCYSESLLHQVGAYAKLETLNEILHCTADGFPVVVGIAVYESFESDAVAKTGIVPMPQQNEALVGGHAVCIVGFDATAQTLLLRNSWGKWGMDGYFTISFDYVTSGLASDMWSIRKEQNF